MSEKENRYLCDIEGCGYSTGDKSNFNRHKLKHGTERNYVCSVCGKAFKVSSNLRTHELIHKKDREKKYVCSVCEKAFDELTRFTEHQTTHRKEVHKCPFCLVRRNSSHSLRRHINKNHNFGNQQQKKDIDQLDKQGEEEEQTNPFHNEYEEPPEPEDMNFQNSYI
jgi:uncharacterized Zn-finger protein